MTEQSTPEHAHDVATDRVRHSSIRGIVSLALMLALASLACSDGGTPVLLPSGSSGTPTADPGGTFEATWSGANDVDLAVTGTPTGVTCTKSQSSTGGVGTQTETVSCLDAMGKPVNGIYRVTVANNGAATQSVTFKSPSSNHAATDLTRDYTSGRVRTIYVVRTNSVFLQLDWTLNEDHDLILLENDLAGTPTDYLRYDGDPSSDYTQYRTLPDFTECAWVGSDGSVFSSHQEAISCSGLKVSVNTFFLDRHVVFALDSGYTAEVRASNGGQGFTFNGTLLTPGARADAFFLIFAGPAI